MKDSLALMAVYRNMLELSSNMIDILERHCKARHECSDGLKLKYQEFAKHTHALIENINSDFHILLKIDRELKELEDDEETEETKTN